MQIFERRKNDSRALIQFPSWDGKLVLAAMLLVGYYLIVIILRDKNIPAENLSVIRDQLVILGPVIGGVFAALFRFTGAEERRDALRSNELQTAMTTPGSAGTADIAENVEDGARKGAAEGTQAGIEGANLKRQNEAINDLAVATASATNTVANAARDPWDVKP